MVSTPAGLLPEDAESVTVEQLTKDLLFIKKQYNTMYNTVQSLSSQVMRLDRDVRALSLRRDVR
ncbi:MAG TPA: hypothetical protein VKA46_09780 [Gemmataceae bacterium]|nr:hypothetical protein [Gemmataceae bacterium]